MGPLPRSKCGNRFILVFKDYFTKWLEIVPIKNAKDRKVRQHFMELILLRIILITDNSTQYTVKVLVIEEWKVITGSLRLKVRNQTWLSA